MLFTPSWYSLELLLPPEMTYILGTVAGNVLGGCLSTLNQYRHWVPAHFWPHIETLDILFTSAPKCIIGIWGLCRSLEWTKVTHVSGGILRQQWCCVTWCIILQKVTTQVNCVPRIHSSILCCKDNEVWGYCLVSCVYIHCKCFIHEPSRMWTVHYCNCSTSIIFANNEEWPE